MSSRYEFAYFTDCSSAWKELQLSDERGCSSTVVDQLTWIVSLFLAADLARMAVGLFITLARQPNTGCQMNLEILTPLMASNDSWKHFFSAVTSVTSALEVF